MGTARRKLLSLIGLYALVVSVSLLLYLGGFLDSWQEKVTDRFYTRYEPQQPIVIIAIDDESLAAIGQWPWPRATFAKAVDAARGTVVGIDVSFSEPSRLGAPDDRSLANALRDIGTTTAVLPIQLLPRGKVSAEPLPLFQEHAATGYVNLPVDSDGVIRRATLARDGYESFSSLLVRSATSDSRLAASPPEFRIRYAGPAKTFLTIPFIDLVSGRVPPSVLEHSIVLIGVTADDLHDIVSTPFGLMPGVEAHANAIETLLDGVFLHEMPRAAAVPLMLIADLLALALIARVRRLYVLIPALAAILLALNLLALLLFSYAIIVPILYLDLSFLVTCGLGIAFEYASESREKRFIRKTFQYYLMPEVVQELIEHPEKLALGGKRKDMTILFSDIRDFTSISERLSPTELTRVMNTYLTAMTDIVMENKGLVDKYIGDAVMAFWGAPLDNPSQAADACRTAVRMAEKLAELNVGWKADGLPELSIRIGIASGSVVVGNMGSLKRFNYTVMGDEVNFASRLESLNKTYGTICIVSESTRHAVDSTEFSFRELDLVRVKGKQEPKTIFELITQAPDSKMGQVLSSFAEGREAYAKGDWSRAAEQFEKALESGPDGPSVELLRRVREFAQHPPAPWNGVYTFTSK